MKPSISAAIRLLQSKGLLGKQEGYSGNNWISSCPFPANHGGRKTQNTPSFGIHEDSGQWHCFSCKKSGSSIYRLVAVLTGTREEDAEAAIGVPRATPESIKEALLPKKSKKPRLKGSYPATVSLTASVSGRTYIESRGIPEAIWRAARLEFCPSEWMPDSNVPGNRIIFPIHWHGERVGYSGRSLDPKSSIKYYRPIEHIGQLLYDPGNVLGKERTVALVEGEMDVLACLREGLPAVGSFGSYLGPAQAAALARVDRLILLYDPDASGLKGVQNILEDYSKELNTKVLWLPENMDPGSMPVGYGDVIRAALNDEPRNSYLDKLSHLLGK